MSWVPPEGRKALERTFHQAIKFKRATKLARKTQKTFNIISGNSGLRESGTEIDFCAQKFRPDRSCLKKSRAYPYLVKTSKEYPPKTFTARSSFNLNIIFRGR
jgi:hypothetical protein